jgi:hypothetical protein
MVVHERCQFESEAGHFVRNTITSPLLTQNFANYFSLMKWLSVCALSRAPRPYKQRLLQRCEKGSEKNDAAIQAD